jgi:rubrerythrin
VGDDDLRHLITELQHAYSGELAACYAYRGHWNSVSRADERARIREIENEEWHHRTLVGEMLLALGARPLRTREAVFAAIGRTLGALCHVSGWFLPMYGAWRLEQRNVLEYERAAAFARGCNHEELIPCLLEMAEVEREHERYFGAKVSGRGDEVVLARVKVPDLRADLHVDAVPRELAGDANRVLDRERVGAPVAHDAAAVDAE